MTPAASSDAAPSGRQMIPFIVPFALFAGLAALGPLLEKLPGFAAGPFAGQSAHLIYPLQTILCGIAILLFWRHLGVGRVTKPLMTIAIALLVLLLWVAPVLLPGAARREEGFNPEALGDAGPVFWSILALRFLRLVVVVPIMEEVFWRGFLQRYLIREDFQSVPFGAYTPLSFFGVAIAFTLVHSPADYPAALACGLLYGWLAIRGKSLASCIAAHAITNLLLGLFILATRQWGFW